MSAKLTLVLVSAAALMALASWATTGGTALAASSKAGGSPSGAAAVKALRRIPNFTGAGDGFSFVGKDRRFSGPQSYNSSLGGVSWDVWVAGPALEGRWDLSSGIIIFPTASAASAYLQEIHDPSRGCSTKARAFAVGIPLGTGGYAETCMDHSDDPLPTANIGFQRGLVLISLNGAGRTPATAAAVAKAILLKTLAAASPHLRAALAAR